MAVRLTVLQIPRLHIEDPLQQDVVFSRFAALYLPRTVELYLNPPQPSLHPMWEKSIPLVDFKLANAYGYMLVHLNGNPYFNRFFRNYKEVRYNLIMAILTRLDDRTLDWEARAEPVGGIAVESMVYDYCQLLSSLLLMETEDSVHELGHLPTVKHLMPFLDWWVKREPNHPASTLRTILVGEDKAGLRIARAERGGLATCAMRDCKKRMAIDGGALLQCSQCVSVRYVSHTSCCEHRAERFWKSVRRLISAWLGSIPRSCIERCATRLSFELVRPDPAP